MQAAPDIFIPKPKGLWTPESVRRGVRPYTLDDVAGRPLEPHEAWRLQREIKAIGLGIGLGIGSDRWGAGTPVSDLVAIMGANVIADWDARYNVTVATGVSSWLDLIGGVEFAQATAAAQPLYNATAGPNSTPRMLFDGSDDFLQATFARPAPATTPTVVWMIAKQVSWAANDALCADITANCCGLRQRTSSPQISQFIGADVNLNGAATIGSWVRIKAHFTGSTSDLLRIISTSVTGASAGNSAGTDPLLGRNAAGTLFANYELARFGLFNAIPSAGQDTDLDTLCTSTYGSGLV